MAEYCKVCGIKLKGSNTVDYRPGSCRDCELERKKLYSGVSIDFSIRSKKASKKKKKRKPRRKKRKPRLKARGRKRGKKIKLTKGRLKKQKKLKAKKQLRLKRLLKIRSLRDKKRKKLRTKLEKLRKLRAKKLLRLKALKKKQKDRERKEKLRIKLRIKKAKERERRLLRKERERLKREKEKLRDVVRQEKERVRASKKAEKERIRAEKLRLRLEKQKEKERLKRAKEAAKHALVQAREQARQAAQEARRLREEAKKPPMVSVVTKVKEILPPPDARVIGAMPKEQLVKTPQPTKKLDPQKPGLTIAAQSLLEHATVIPAKADPEKEKNLLKQSGAAIHAEAIQKKVEELQKEKDPIIDRYNPYDQKTGSPPSRPPVSTPWDTESFSIVGGEIKKTKLGEGSGVQGGLSEDQVKEIIQKIKNEHKRKSS